MTGDFRSQPKPAEPRRDPPVCVHCDNDLSCGACGMEQPYDDISLLKARIQELEGALREIETKTNGDRHTVNPENAFEHWGKLNAALVIIRGFARAALKAKPAGETGHDEHLAKYRKAPRAMP